MKTAIYIVSVLIIIVLALGIIVPTSSVCASGLTCEVTATPRPSKTPIPPTNVPPTEIPPTIVPPTRVPPTLTSIPPTEIPPTEPPHKKKTKTPVYFYPTPTAGQQCPTDCEFKIEVLRLLYLILEKVSN